MAYQYKIFKCDLCSKDNPCYCMIRQEIEEIKDTDLWNCLIQGSENVDWKEINNTDLFNIKNIINKLI